MKKNVFQLFVFAAIVCLFFSSCATVGNVSHFSCTGIRQKPRSADLNYKRTSIYKEHVKRINLGERTARAAKRQSLGLYRYN